MNMASGKIADYWNAKLEALEKRLEEGLDDEERKGFLQWGETWRSYRLQSVELMTGGNGSIMPLRVNLFYSQITKQRAEVLESIMAGLCRVRWEWVQHLRRDSKGTASANAR